MINFYYLMISPFVVFKSGLGSGASTVGSSTRFNTLIKAFTLTSPPFDPKGPKGYNFGMLGFFRE